MRRHLLLVIGLILCVSSLTYGQEAVPAPSPSPKPAMTKSTESKDHHLDREKTLGGMENKQSKVFKTYLSADSVMVGDAGVGD